MTVISNDVLHSEIVGLATSITNLTGRSYAIDASDPITNTNMYDSLKDLEAQVLELQKKNADLESALTSLQPKVDAIEADAVGSWVLDKASGIMTLYNTSGYSVAKFAITETEEQSVKERRTDLEVAV